MNIAFFDFDGTITTRDSMIDFFIYSAGYKNFLKNIILLLPSLLMYKMKLIPNWEAKEKALEKFFKGWQAEKLKRVAFSYSKDRLPQIIRKGALTTINTHKKNGDRVVVVSASADIWLKPWTDSLNLELISTKLEITDGLITGRLDSKNCYGFEKVVQIQQRYDLKNYEIVYAYGDSNGDRDMLNLADIKYYKGKKIL